MKLSLVLTSAAKLTDLAPVLEAAKASGAVVEATLEGTTIGALAIAPLPLVEDVKRPRAKTIGRPPAKLAKRDDDAPYGRKKDGTPRRKPGRKTTSKRKAKS